VAVRRLGRGNRNIAWIETYCRVPEGKFVGQPVKLRPWQKKIIRGIYDSPTRRCIISFGRKNAKTTLAGMLCLLHLCGPEAKANSQLFSAAQSREQASILFSLMAKMVRMSPDLAAVIAVRESAKQLVCSELGSVYRALSAEASTAYGLSPVFVVHDELGQVVGPRSQLYEALETASGAQEEPLSIVISTQAPTDADLLSLLIDDAAAGHDPKIKLFMWAAAEDADPFTKETIRSANPAFGDFLNAEVVLEQARSAKRMPSREADYRNLVLNQRVNRNDPFVTQTVWKANGEPPREEDWQRGVVAALDLSELIDLTALVWVGQGDDGAWSVGCEFFAPAEGVRDRAMRDRVPYDLWAQQGFLQLTPGSSIDYGFVAQRLGEFCQRYPTQQLTFDRWGMRIMRSELAHAGFDDLPLDEKGHGQGTQDMTPALIALETELLNHNLRHGNHPILTWCAANAVAYRGPAGDRKLNKSKSTGRIDGMVALAMAINRARALVAPEGLDDWLATV
jgi:phage terminase large subunit-like protein